MNGQAMKRLNNGDAAGALAIVSDQHKRDELRRLLQNPAALATCTPEFIAQLTKNIPDVYQRWESAVEQAFNSIGIHIVDTVRQVIPSKNQVKRRACSIVIVGDTTQIRHCPLCDELLVPLNSMTPEQFRDEFTGMHFLKYRIRFSCKHYVPITPEQRRIIENRRFMLNTYR